MIVVHDGKDKLARVIGQFCNTNYYVELLSTGPDMYVEFISRSHFPGQGFKASYHFEEELHYALGAPSTGQCASSTEVIRAKGPPSTNGSGCYMPTDLTPKVLKNIYSSRFYLDDSVAES